MKPIARTSLRMRLVGLVLLAVVPLLATVLVTSTYRRRAAASTAEQHALQIAQLAAAGQVRLFEGARQLLSALAQMPEIRQLNGPGSSPVLARLAAEHRFYLNLGVVGMEGQLLSSALPFVAPINQGDRLWFTEAIHSGQFAIGGHQLGKVTGRPSVGLAYPVLDASNAVAGVVYAAVDLASLSYQFSQLDLPPGVRLVLIDRHGIVLAASAGNRDEVGQATPELAVLRRTAISRTARVTRTTEVRGTDCIYAFAPVSVGRSGREAWVSVGLPLAGVFAEANRQLQQDLAGWGFITLIALAAAWFGSEFFILRRVRALVWAARQMRDGQLGARTGLPHGADELGQLAAAFDEMATALEQRDAERLRAADALRRSRDELEQRVGERAAELSQERNLLDSLVNSLPDYIYVKDREGRYLVDNAMHRALLGVHRLEDVAGRTAADFFPPEMAARFQADDTAVLASGVPLYNRQEEVVDVNGNRLQIITTKVPLRDNEGRIIGLVGVGRDVGERLPVAGVPPKTVP